MEIVNSKFKCLNPYAEGVPQIKDLAQKAGVEPGVILGAIGSVGVLITILFFGIGNILTLLITVLYPAARSILALESGGTEDDKEWLTYWIIFGLFSLVDDFFGFILSYIPYFYWIKLALFAYLLLPQTRGASTIYNKFVKDFLEKNKDKISAFVSDVKNTGSKIASEA